MEETLVVKMGEISSITTKSSALILAYKNKDSPFLQYFGSIKMNSVPLSFGPGPSTAIVIWTMSKKQLKQKIQP